jgi:hypothetical protein
MLCRFLAGGGEGGGRVPHPTPSIKITGVDSIDPRAAYRDTPPQKPIRLIIKGETEEIF